MYNHHIILAIILEILTTTAFVIDLTTPTSLFQDHNTTSNSTIGLQAPNPPNSYYVQCERVSDLSQPGLNPSNCLILVPEICDWLVRGRHLPYDRGEWGWVRRPGCALGFFLPRGRVDIPNEVECNSDIYGALLQQCAFDSRYNVGSINVMQLPKGRNPGLPMTEGYPRYILAPEEL